MRGQGLGFHIPVQILIAAGYVKDAIRQAESVGLAWQYRLRLCLRRQAAVEASLRQVPYDALRVAQKPGHFAHALHDVHIPVVVARSVFRSEPDAS